MGALVNSVAQYMASNWEVILDAPLVFMLSLLIGAVVTWLFMRRSLNSLEKAITAQEKMIVELRQRLGEAEPQAIYSKLTNQELKDKTVTHAHKIREFTERQQVKSSTPDGGTIIDFSQETDEFGNLMTIDQTAYRQKFHVETLRLRDELWSRLPPTHNPEELFGSGQICVVSYTETPGVQCIRAVADDLERLAESLKL